VRESSGVKPMGEEKSNGQNHLVHDQLPLHFCAVSSESAYVGTRKMVNYA
jgi:hypothetical protein